MTNLAHGDFDPFVYEGAGVGQWVVLCDGTAATTYGGRFMDPNDQRDTTRATAIFAAITRAEDEGTDYYLDRTDQQIAQAVRDELRVDTDLIADRALILYKRWVQLWHTAGIFLKDRRDDSRRRVEAEANSIYATLKRWVQQGQDRPEQGGWICHQCYFVRDWHETVDGIAEVDPDNVLVRQRTEGRVSEYTYSLKGGYWNNEVSTDKIWQHVKQGLTHRCVMNADW